MISRFAERAFRRARQHNERWKHELDIDPFALIVAHPEFHIHAALLAPPAGDALDGALFLARNDSLHLLREGSG